MKHVLTLTLALATASLAQAQQLTIKGKVLDEQRRPVPYASVGQLNNEPGTATNEAGEFSLRVASLPRKITVISLGYAPTTVDVKSATEPLVISLSASTVALPEVRVRNPEQVASELVKRAYAKLARHQRQEQYGKAFYRQKQRHNGTYSEFLDAFYDVRFTSQGVGGWQLEQARYATAAEDTGVDMTNFSAAVRLIPVFEPKPSRRTLAVPLSPLAEKQFKFQLREILQDKGQQTAVIDYTPRLDLNQPATFGTLYLDMESAALRRVESNVPIGSLMSLQFSEGTTLSSQSFRMVTDFSPVADSLSRLQAIRAEQTIVLSYQGKPDTTSISGNLFFYQHTAKPAAKGYKTTGVNYNDLKQAMKQNYNAKFWRDREILRASPVEEQVIRDLERRKAFGSF
ncbi:carboxypeptidase-like regulatory domain-containing protein [Hymenobacter sp. HSC-4F20]|uniref:carboxypeptidase-like regulatory domain-containing protein n=1 Tax=Hymenobacter sp. HSC-4F20 TaxID=2864135 RepID=UPI001C73C835|nr:carboxypeptidase-like regulatory domain-containing protein [Hymenobacter sp. HSC-4F20]MBX0290566.1 carboxypeptidase-like regulatory domain-containing protein [Hymenobacter sp. HSC-4F20]